MQPVINIIDAIIDFLLWSPAAVSYLGSWLILIALLAAFGVLVVLVSVGEWLFMKTIGERIGL